MSFGCLALWSGRNCNSLSDVTDKYEIGQTLRTKEFCELCLAKDRLTNKVFFCKKFFKKDGRKVRKAAKNEIIILKMITHPNILQLIDTFETREEFFIIQELATGGDVFEWILDQGNYTERDASNVIRQVLEALAYLHSLNIVHRNLKLENLMYYTENNHNKVVLRDFYLSRFENGPITEPCGTPEYLAPEVVARHRYGRPVDCWAVGVIMYILLSGNPPFYDEAEEENTDQHNRIIFCRIVAGEFEFDSPYWDDISPAAKELVCKLMEVDPMLRITAQDALCHEWISGQGASEKNLKDGVCAQFKKNFAKAKWRKAIRVTTFMQRLRAPESRGKFGEREKPSGDAGGESQDGGMGTPGINTSVSHQVGTESPEGRKEQEGGENGGIKNVRERTTVANHLLLQHSSFKMPGEKTDRQGEGMRKGNEGDVHPLSAFVEQNKATTDKTPSSFPPDPKQMPDSGGTKMIVLGQKIVGGTQADSSEFTTCQNMAAMKAHNLDCCSGSAAAAMAPPADQNEALHLHEKEEERRPYMTPGSWCQTQLPEPVAERRRWMSGPGDLNPEVRSQMVPEVGGRSEFVSGKINRDEKRYEVVHSEGFEHSQTASYHEQGDASHFGSHYISSSSADGGATAVNFGQGTRSSSDWQMDSVIEQIEKQMAAVFEKIEEDMPSLLEQISDHPEPKQRGGSSPPSSRPTAHCTATSPPIASLLRLSMHTQTCPPPSHQSEQDKRDESEPAEIPGESSWMCVTGAEL